MAEMPLIPYAAAVAAALHDATGVWFHEIPLTPSRVVAELRRHGVGASDDGQRGGTTPEIGADS